MQPDFAKLTGAPSGTSWSQVHDFTPVDQDRLLTRGRLVAIISSRSAKVVLTSGGIEDVALGRTIISRLHEEYFGNTKRSAFDALKRSVEKVSREFSGQIENFELSTLSFLHNTLYIAIKGGGRVVLLRDGVLVNILEGEEKKVVTASGYPKAGDTVLVGNESFFKGVTPQVLTTSLGATEAKASAEELVPTLRRSSMDGIAALAILKFTSVVPIPNVAEKPKVEEALQVPEDSAGPVSGSTRAKLAGYVGLALKYFPDKRIVIKSDTRDLGVEKNRKTAVLVGVILLSLLGVSVFFGVRQRVDKDSRSKYEPRLEQAQDDFAESQSLAALNPVRARELLLGARGTVLGIKAEEVEDERLDELIDQINQSIGEIAGIYEVEPELFIDVSLLTNDFDGDDLDISEGRMLVLDSESKKIVSSHIDTKKSAVVAGPDVIPGGWRVAAYSNRNFILDRDGVWEIEGETATRVVEKDWSGDGDLYLYAGNIYVMDDFDSTISRYSGIVGGFAAGQDWFGSGVSPDLSDLVAWTIDGSVWVLRNNGKISKFTLGNQEAFSLTGLETPISMAVDIYTNEDARYLYVLDPQNSRIVVLDKKGQFKAEYLSEKISEAKKIVVSEDEGKAIFITGPKLYSIELQHLN